MTKKKESIWLESFPKANAEWNFNAEAEDFKVLLNIRGEVTKKLEELRKENNFLKKAAAFFAKRTD